MARVNINILRISELKWTEMGEFNLDDHYIYYCVQESLRKNGVAFIVNKKRLKCSTWIQSQKWQNDFCSFQRQTIQYYSNLSLYPNQLCWISWSWMVLWRSTRLSRSNTQNGHPFHYRGQGYKSSKSRNTWSNRQIWPWSIKWTRERLTEFF